jgi:type III secretion protein C
MGSLLQALQDDREVSIVMTPKLITQDGKTSNIFIGQNIPFIGSQTTNSGPNTVTTQNLEYRDVGMNLTLTPVLGNSDTVTLTINLENTNEEKDASGNTITSGSVNGITTSKTTMTTTVHIPNKNFLVLSGMARDEKIRDKAGIPCLGGLPFIGAAFSQANTSKTKTNLVIFIRPHIINSYKDMVDLTDAQEDSFRENAGNALLEQEFEEGIERIKGLDDEEMD